MHIGPSSPHQEAEGIVLPVVLRTSWGGLLVDILNSNIYVFILYLYNMYLKIHWFSIYGGNIKFPFKINLFFLF